MCGKKARDKLFVDLLALDLLVVNYGALVPSINTRYMADM